MSFFGSSQEQISIYVATLSKSSASLSIDGDKLPQATRSLRIVVELTSELLAWSYRVPVETLQLLGLDIGQSTEVRLSNHQQSKQTHLFRECVKVKGCLHECVGCVMVLSGYLASEASNPCRLSSRLNQEVKNHNKRYCT